MKKITLMLAFLVAVGWSAYSQDEEADKKSKSPTEKFVEEHTPVADGDHKAVLNSVGFELTGDAKFEFGVDLTSVNVDREDSAVAGIKNAFTSSLKVIFLKKGDSTNTPEGKKVYGFVKFKDLGLNIEYKAEIDSTDDPDTSDLIDHVEAEIVMGPAFINILGRDWGDYNMSKSSYLSSITSDIDSDYTNGLRNLKHASGSNNDYDTDAAVTNSYLSPGGDVDSGHTGIAPEYRGISIGARFPDVLDFAIDFASRYDWYAGGINGEPDGHNFEKPNSLDIAYNTDIDKSGQSLPVTPNGSKTPYINFDSDHRLGQSVDADNYDLKKNFGHDYLLGFNIQLKAVKNLTLELWTAFALGNWDKDIKGDYSSSGFKSEETLDPIYLGFKLDYGIEIGDSMKLTPGFAMDFIAGTYYKAPSIQNAFGTGSFALPDTMRLDMSAGLLFQWGATKKDDGTMDYHKQVDNDLFGVNFDNKERKEESDLTPKAYGDDDDEEALPGVSLTFNVFDAIHKAKKYSMIGNRDFDSKDATDLSMGLKLSTYEPAKGGVAPVVGWALSLELYNLGRKYTYDGDTIVDPKDAKVDFQDNIGSDDDLIQWDAIRYAMGLKIFADLSDIEGLPAIKPFFAYTLLENAKAHKFGLGVDLGGLVENTTFTLKWESDRIFFGDTGKVFYRQTKSDFGTLLFITKIDW